MTIYKGQASWSTADAVGNMAAGGFTLSTPIVEEGTAADVYDTLLAKRVRYEPFYDIVANTNDWIDINHSTVGAEENIQLTAGGYSATDLASHIDAALTAQSGAAGNWTVTWNKTTNKFSIATSTGTVALLWKTGAHGSDNLDDHVQIGFDDTADDAAAASHTADNIATAAGPMFLITSGSLTASPRWLCFYKPRVITTAGDTTTPTTKPTDMQVNVYSHTSNLGGSAAAWQASGTAVAEVRCYGAGSATPKAQDEMVFVWLGNTAPTARGNWAIWFSDEDGTDLGLHWFEIGYLALYVPREFGDDGHNSTINQQRKLTVEGGQVRGARGAVFRNVGPVKRSNTYTVGSFDEDEADELEDWLVDDIGKPAAYILDNSRLSAAASLLDPKAAIFGVEPKGEMLFSVRKIGDESNVITINIEQVVD